MADDPETELFKQSTSSTWSHVGEALLRRFLTDDYLQTGYKAVTQAEPELSEDQSQVCGLLSKASSLCRHVFRQANVVNYFVCRFTPAVQELVAQHVRMFPQVNGTNLNALNQTSIVFERSHRALLKIIPQPMKKWTKSTGVPQPRRVQKAGKPRQVQ